MTEEIQTSNTADTTEAEATPQISNAEIKAHPLFSKLTSELAELRRADAERKAAEEQAKKEAELKKAEAEGRYQDALKQRESELEALRAAHSKELLDRDLTTEMLKAGFGNEIFLRGAVSAYDADKWTVSEYVASLAGDDANKAFLASSGGAGRASLPEPGKPPVNGSKQHISAEQLKAMEASSSLEERQKAREDLRAYRLEHGKYPE